MSTDLVLPPHLRGGDEANDIGYGFVVTKRAEAPSSICPVCARLPLRELASSNSELSLTYKTSFDSVPRDELRAWAGHCDLAKLVRDLEMYWGNQNDQIDLYGDEVFKELCERGFREGNDRRERWLICGIVGERIRALEQE